VSPAELLARGRDEVTGYGGEIIAAEVSDVSVARDGCRARRWMPGAAGR
jgi:hypothetical protein